MEKYNVPFSSLKNENPHVFKNFRKDENVKNAVKISKFFYSLIFETSKVKISEKLPVVKLPRNTSVKKC